MTGSLSPRHIGRLAGLLFAGSGALSFGYLLLPAPDTRSRAVVLSIAAGAVLVGLAVWFAPWHRWPRYTSLFLVPPAFALIAVGNYYGSTREYTFGIFFIVVFAWIGIGHRRWTALASAPLGVIAYVVPILLSGGDALDASSVALAIPVAVLVGEGLSWLAERERRSQEQAHALARLATALGAHITEEDVFQALVDEGRLALGAEHAVLYRIDPADRVIRGVYAAGVREPYATLLEELEGVPLPTITFVDPLERGEPIRVEDTANPPHPQPEAVELFRLRSYMLVPILAGGRLIGALTCGETSKRRRYGPEDIELATAIAGQASAAMRNAMLYRETLETALRDPLTDLGNRRAFHENLEEEVERSRRHGRALSLAFLDLDGLKTINDSLGHHAGDRALQDLARLFGRTLRRTDGAYRIGGDEFAVILPETPRSGATALAERVRREVARARLGGGGSVRLGVSIGIASYPDHSIDPDGLCARADAAMYEVKASGGDAVGLAIVEDDTTPDLRFGVNVRAVLEADHLTPTYQPIVDVDCGRVVGYEGFAQVDPRHGSAPTSTLFRAAQALGLADALDRTCLAVVLGGADELPDKTDLYLNITSATLTSGFDARTLSSAVTDAGLSPDRIVLEVPVRGPRWTSAAPALRRCRDLGFRVALDDVGPETDPGLAGRVEAEILKVDWAFVRGAATGEREEMLEAVRELVGSSTYAIAEGIEQPEELETVRDLGFSAAQGYLFGHPSPRFEEPSSLAAPEAHPAPN